MDFLTANRIRIIGSMLLLLLMTSGCSLFYQPRPYEPQTLIEFRSNPQHIELPFEIEGLQQTAYYVGPRENPQSPPDQLWVFFGGLTALALDWLPWIEHIPNHQQCGFLLVEFPGYGASEGLTRGERMLKASHRAFQELAIRLNTTPETIEKNLGVLGHSMGAATALQFATEVDVKRIVLISPFTSMQDITAHRYNRLTTWFYNQINPENYDNRARLRELGTRPQPPEIFVFHGDTDTVIPVSMGRELAAMFPKQTTYYEMKGKGHTEVIRDTLPLIAQ